MFDTHLDGQPVNLDSLSSGIVKMERGAPIPSGKSTKAQFPSIAGPSESIKC